MSFAVDFLAERSAPACVLACFAIGLATSLSACDKPEEIYTGKLGPKAAICVRLLYKARRLCPEQYENFLKMLNELEHALHNQDSVTAIQTAQNLKSTAQMFSVQVGPRNMLIAKSVVYWADVIIEDAFQRYSVT